MKFHTLLLMLLVLFVTTRCAQQKLMPDKLVIKNEEIKLNYGISSDKTSAKQQVVKQLIKILQRVVKNTNELLSHNEKIHTLDISSTTNGRHAKNSYHYFGLAMDINGINGVKVTELKKNNQIIFLQEVLDKESKVIENFGPHIKNKKIKEGSMKKNIHIRHHHNHIHFSVYRKN